mmetsp:Transcript_50481/g.117210  ORF Transcript_50481/g.117210 Transcript_50481/m.117210 type:complete len:204 (-) Transcript_50481:244-855(-)
MAAVLLFPQLLLLVGQGLPQLPQLSAQGGLLQAAPVFIPHSQAQAAAEHLFLRSKVADFTFGAAARFALLLHSGALHEDLVLQALPLFDAGCQLCRSIVLQSLFLAKKRICMVEALHEVARCQFNASVLRLHLCQQLLLFHEFPCFNLECGFEVGLGGLRLGHVLGRAHLLFELCPRHLSEELLARTQLLVFIVEGCPVRSQL